MSDFNLAYHWTSTKEGDYLLVICKRNEDGCHVYGGDRPIRFTSEEEARACARDMNHRLGMTPREAAEIVASTMTAIRRVK